MLQYFSCIPKCIIFVRRELRIQYCIIAIPTSSLSTVFYFSIFPNEFSINLLTYTYSYIIILQNVFYTVTKLTLKFNGTLLVPLHNPAFFRFKINNFPSLQNAYLFYIEFHVYFLKITYTVLMNSTLLYSSCIFVIGIHCPRTPIYNLQIFYL